MTVEQYFSTMSFDENLNSNCECYNDQCVKRVLTFYDFEKSVEVNVCNMHYRLCIENNTGSFHGGYYYKDSGNEVARQLTTLIGKNLVIAKYNIETTNRSYGRVTNLHDITIGHTLSYKPFTYCYFKLIDLITYMINSANDNGLLKHHLNIEIKNALKSHLADINFKKYGSARLKVQAAINKLKLYDNYENNLLEILIDLFNLNIKTANDEIIN